MANTKSAAKRARQTIKRTTRNRSALSALKSTQKRAQTALGGEKAALQTAQQALVSELDRAVKRGVIHKNVANRRKSRLAKKLATA